MVLAYTLAKYASEPFTIEWMRQAPAGPWSGWKNASARTPFTHFRWGIPDACGYQGRAIYVDVDFFFRADVSELWHQPVPSVLALRSHHGKLPTSCLLFDCAAANGHVPTIAELRRLPDANSTVTSYFEANRHLLSDFEGNWNCILDKGGPPDLHDPSIKAIHYSRVEWQLHLKYAIPRLKAEGRSHWYTGPTGPHPRTDLQALFDAEYQAALAAGYTLKQFRVPPFAKATRRDFTYAHSKVSA